MFVNGMTPACEASEAPIHSGIEAWSEAMIGERQTDQTALLRLDRLRLRGPCGAHDEFLLAATAQNLRKPAKLIPVTTPVLAK
jgi:hypothetical protein